MAEQKQDDQLEPTYSSSVLIRHVTLKTCWKQWTIGKGGTRGSGISVLMARHEDDDDYVTKAVQDVEGTSCGWWYCGSWYADMLYIASLCVI